MMLKFMMLTVFTFSTSLLYSAVKESDILNFIKDYDRKLEQMNDDMTKVVSTNWDPEEEV